MTWLADTESPIATSDLYALSFSNQYEAYAVGKSGTIMHYDVTAHATFSPSAEPTTISISPSTAPTAAPTYNCDELMVGEIKVCNASIAGGVL